MSTWVLPVQGLYMYIIWCKPVDNIKTTSIIPVGHWYLLLLRLILEAHGSHRSPEKQQDDFISYSVKSRYYLSLRYGRSLQPMIFVPVLVEIGPVVPEKKSFKCRQFIFAISLSFLLGKDCARGPLFEQTRIPVLSAKFGWDWPICSGEKDLCMLSMYFH